MASSDTPKKTAKRGTKSEGSARLGSDSTSYIGRPRRKPDSSTRGTLKRWDGTDYCEFHPSTSTGTNRTMINTLGDSTFYRTEGQKESSIVAHLNVDGQSPDPVNELFAQLSLLTEGQRKTIPQLPEGSQGRMLYDNGSSLQVWLDTDAHKVSILTSLVCAPDIERQLLQAQATMNVTLGRYRQEIVNLGTHKL